MLKHHKVKNILAIRNDRFGEFLLNVPVFRALKETFPDASLTVVIDPYLRELARGIEFIDAVIEWKKKKHSLLQQLRLAGLLRKKKFDIAIILNPSKEFNLIVFLAGIPIRAGYDRKRAFLLTHKMKDRKYLGLKHEVEYNLELAGMVGAKTKDTSLTLMVDEDLMRRLFKGGDLCEGDAFIVLHPFTSDSIKQWPYERFQALAAQIVEKFKMKVVIIGGMDEFYKSLELFPETGEWIINLTGRTALEQLAVLLTKSRFLISGDSGPVHLACAVGTRVIAIFRNDIPGKGPTRWGPWGKGSVAIQKKALEDITVDEVMGVAAQVLNEESPSD